MEYLLLACALVAYFGGTLYLGNLMVDGQIWAIVAFTAWIVFGLTVLLWAVAQEDAKGPCAKYETRMMYNAATKTVMPARFCVDRGEWVK